MSIHYQHTFLSYSAVGWCSCAQCCSGKKPESIRLGMLNALATQIHARYVCKLMLNDHVGLIRGANRMICPHLKISQLLFTNYNHNATVIYCGNEKGRHALIQKLAVYL